MRYKLLGRSGLRVSELCLGTMTFGETWGWGASKEESRRIFDAYVEAGGNFIDTSCNYTDGTSEEFVGEFIASQRSKMVVATKYSLTANHDDPNAGGNHRKNMMQSIEGSLRRLKTDYIDLYYLHMWDGMTPVEEVMRGLDDLVRSGKVLYVGISDTPAWVAAQANTIADLRGWSRLVALQVPYSLTDRGVERDLLPMAKAFEVSVAAWGLLESGELTGKYNAPNGEPKRSREAGAQNLKVAEALIKLAQEIGHSPSQIAINWVRQQQARSQIIPIIGARKLAHLQDNLACLTFELTPEQIDNLAALTEFSPGFPHSFLNSDHVRGLIFGNTFAKIDTRR